MGANLEDYDWKNIPPNLVEFLQDLVAYWNGGELPLKSTGSPPLPSTQANGKELRVEKDGNQWYMYVHTDDTDGWQKTPLSGI